MKNTNTGVELPDIISDFNNRPHISLDGLTPNEAERGAPLNQTQLKENIRQAGEERKRYNSTHRCGQCS